MVAKLQGRMGEGEGRGKRKRGGASPSQECFVEVRKA